MSVLSQSVTHLERLNTFSFLSPFSICSCSHLWNTVFWRCLLPSGFCIHSVSGCSHRMQSATKWDKADQCLNLLCCILTRGMKFCFFSCTLVLSSHCISLAMALHVPVVTIGLQSKSHLWPAGVGRWSYSSTQPWEATPRVLCSVLGPSLQEVYWNTGACPEKSNKAGEGSREQVLGGAAEGSGAV